MIATQLDRRRRLQAVAGAALLVAATVGFFGAAARADTAQAEVSKAAWYWESARKVNVPNTGLQVQPPNPHADGHLPVAVDSGNPDKRSYLQWDLAALNAGEITRFAVTIPVSTTDAAHAQEHADASGAGATSTRPPQTANDANASIMACPVSPGEFLVDGAEGAPTTITTVNESGEPQEIRQEPEFDCGLASATLARSDDGTAWTGDLAPVADLWASGGIPNNGIVLRPAVDGASPQQTWQVEFHREGITAAVDFRPAQPPGGRFVDGGGTPTAVLGSDQLSFAPTPGGLTTETIPPVPGQAAGGQQILRRLGQDPGAGVGHLPWYVWTLAPVGLAGLYLMSRALRPEWMEALAGRENRIASTLRARRLEVAPS